MTPIFDVSIYHFHFLQAAPYILGRRLVWSKTSKPPDERRKWELCFSLPVEETLSERRRARAGLRGVFRWACGVWRYQNWAGWRGSEACSDGLVEVDVVRERAAGIKQLQNGIAPPLNFFYLPLVYNTTFSEKHMLHEISEYL